jgi:iron complex outermembrane receptor protein
MGPVAGWRSRADFYRITIDKRIVLSDNFTGTAIPGVVRQRRLRGVSGGRFFSNAIDTRSNGGRPGRELRRHAPAATACCAVVGVQPQRREGHACRFTPAALRAFQENLFGRVERGRARTRQTRGNNLYVGRETIR